MVLVTEWQPAERSAAGDEGSPRHEPVEDRGCVIEHKVPREAEENEHQGRGEKRSRVSFGSRAPCLPCPRDHKEPCQEHEHKPDRSYLENDPFPLALSWRHLGTAAAEKE